MPQPHIPPDPDQPEPALLEPGSSLIVFSLELSGMTPWDEQKRVGFEFEGKAGAVYVPIAVKPDDPEYTYGGVGIGQLANVNTTFKYAFTLDDGTSESGNLKAEKTTFTAKITTVTVTRIPPKASFSVTYLLDATAGWFAVAVPYMEAMPVYGDLASYAAAHASAKVTGTSGTVTLKVTPGGANRYAIFLAKGLPGEMVPRSAPVIEQL